MRNMEAKVRKKRRDKVMRVKRWKKKEMIV